jgi:hypothetical protein
MCAFPTTGEIMKACCENLGIEIINGTMHQFTNETMFYSENIAVITINNQIFHLHIYKKQKNTDEIMK